MNAHFNKKLPYEASGVSTDKAPEVVQLLIWFLYTPSCEVDSCECEVVT